MYLEIADVYILINAMYIENSKRSISCSVRHMCHIYLSEKA
jgi:hypothetical protein